MSTLDGRWEWHEVCTFDGTVVRHIRGRCLHRDLEPVKSVVTGEVLAQLCLTCDAQLPAWAPSIEEEK